MSLLTELFARRTHGVRLGLDAVHAVHERLGAPAAAIPAIHVLGTNGKGSTAAMAAHALARAGKRVGLYTSPHLLRVGERIRVGGVPVADAELEHAVAAVLAAERAVELVRPLSFFEILTLAGFSIFARAELDVIVVEAGLGGRLDATRLCRPCVTLLTSIALDHQAILGDTLAAIAAEKAAALCAGVPCRVAPQDPEAMAVIVARAQAVGAPLSRVDPLERAPLGLVGEHQRENAALALAGARIVVPALVAEDLDGVSWPGRLQTTPLGGGTVVWDVAHNPAGVAALCRHAGPRARVDRDRVLFGCMADKDGAAMVRSLEGLGLRLLLVPVPDEDPAGLAVLRSALVDPDRAAVFATVDEPALAHEVEGVLAAGGTLWIAGSHRLVGALQLRWLVGRPGTPDPNDPRATPELPGFLPPPPPRG